MNARLSQVVSPGFRRCSKCRKVLPACFGHFYRQKSVSDGFTSWCRECDRQKNKDRYKKEKAAGITRKPSPEKQRQYTADYRERNLEKAKRQARESAKRRRECPKYRLMANAGRRMRDLIKGVNGTSKHFPFTKEEIIRHMERQFTSGMSWENYGSYWHVDHIIPVSSFEPKSRDCPEMMACWSLSNLRPMKAFDNMSKSAKIETLL